MVDVPRLKWPINFIGGAAEIVEQDSDDEVMQCVALVLITIRGERIELPNFGLNSIAFAQTVDIDGIRAAVAEWEPRAAVTLTESPDELDQMIRHVAAVVGLEVTSSG